MKKRIPYLISRPLQLAYGGWRTLRYFGPHLAARQTLRWMRGERGFLRTTLIETIPYEQFCIKTGASPDELRFQRQQANRILAPLRFGLFSHVKDVKNLQHTAQSILAQTYPHWHWTLIIDDDAMKSAIPADSRINAIQGAHNISAVMDAPYVMPIDIGDQLAPQTLYVMASALRDNPDLTALYTDYDRIDHFQIRKEPLFRPDWSPDLMVSHNLLYPAGVFRAADCTSGDIQHVTYRIAENASRVTHIPQVLYHRHVDNPIAIDPTAVQEHLQRRGLEEVVVTHRGQADVRWRVDESQAVSIIIPTRDKADMLRQCLNSLFRMTAYQNYEVILVDAGSVEAETAALYAAYQGYDAIRVVPYGDARFNFSKACNVGARYAGGDLLLFLNNDTEITHADWLHRMLQWFQLPETGIVGGKLLYASGRIQHGGIILGLSGMADNLFAGANAHINSLIGSAEWYRNLMAVTAACMMISRAVFDAVGGFDEAYQLIFSDVDIGVRVNQAGYRVIYDPYVRLIHHESTTHQRRVPLDDLWLASQRMQHWLENGDPFYNPNLSYRATIPAISASKSDSPTSLNRRARVFKPPEYY